MARRSRRRSRRRPRVKLALTGVAVAAAMHTNAASRASTAGPPHAAAPSASARSHRHHTAHIAAPAHVQRWINEAVQVMKAHGMPAPALNRADIALIIQHESGGNPRAINTTDSNAAAGHPSQGLMQTIPATFSAHCLPGYCSDITDPVSNIIAGVRYALGRYGSLGNVPGVAAVREGLPYIGY